MSKINLNIDDFKNNYKTIERVHLSKLNKGVNDHSIDHPTGVNDHSIDHSTGVNDHSTGVNDHSTGVNDHSTGVNDSLLKHFDNINLLPENNTQTIMALSIIAQIAMHTMGNRK